MAWVDESFVGQKSKSLTLLDQALEGKPPEFQRKVLQWVVRTGVKETDELFIIMIAIGQLQSLVEESPRELGKMFESWGERLFGIVEEAKRLACRGMEVEVAALANRLIKQTEIQQSKRFWSSVVPAVGLLAMVLGFGVLVGMTVPIWVQGGYGTGPRKLTVKEASTLTWAMSQEGQLAQNLMKWNSGRLDTQDCLQEAKQLNVTLKIDGKDSTWGACLLWVVPPKQRQF
jgi:hypothetical protein